MGCLSSSFIDLIELDCNNIFFDSYWQAMQAIIETDNITSGKIRFLSNQRQKYIFSTQKI